VKIIQIVISSSGLIYGLGYNGNIYYWHIASKSWSLHDGRGFEKVSW